MKFAKALVQAGVPCCIPLCAAPVSQDCIFDAPAFTGSWATISQRADGEWQLCLTAPANTADTPIVIRKRNCKQPDGSYLYTDELTLTVETENTNQVFFDDFPNGQLDTNVWGTTFPWATQTLANAQHWDQINDQIEGQFYDDDPNGGRFGSCGATGLLLRADGPARSTTGGADRPWTSAMIHQRAGSNLLGGVYTICMRGSRAKGAFPGTWAVGKHPGCTEVDTSEGGNTEHPSSVHQAYHFIGLVDTSEWVPVCRTVDDACHCYSFHFRITDRLDSNGCRIMQGAMTVDCIVTQDWQDLDMHEMLHHIANLAVATRNGWPDVGNPPDQTSMDVCVCSVETREYTDGKSAQFPGHTEPSITTPGQGPLLTNLASDYLDIIANPNPTFTISNGTLAGATLVKTDYIVAKNDDCIATDITGQTSFSIQTTTATTNATVIVRQRFRAADGTCFDLMSDAVFMGTP